MNGETWLAQLKAQRSGLTPDKTLTKIKPPQE